MPDPLPHILFVCVENSCRSQMAEGFARALGTGRAAVFSAGSRPSGRVDPLAVTSMLERGIDITTQESKSLDDLPRGIIWDLVVTMGCGDACPHLPARRRVDWDLPDPNKMDLEAFRRVRDRIEALVEGILPPALGGTEDRQEGKRA